MAPIEPDAKLDCIGFFSPIPIVKTREEMNKLKIGQVLEILADDPAAEEDIKYWTKATGQEIVDLQKERERIRVLIRKVK